MGGLLGGQRVCWPPSENKGRGRWAHAPLLPTPMLINKIFDGVVALRLIPETSTGTLIVKRRTRKVSHL